LRILKPHYKILQYRCMWFTFDGLPLIFIILEKCWGVSSLRLWVISSKYLYEWKYLQITTMTIKECKIIHSSLINFTVPYKLRRCIKVHNLFNICWHCDYSRNFARYWNYLCRSLEYVWDGSKRAILLMLFAFKSLIAFIWTDLYYLYKHASYRNIYKWT